MVMSSDPRCKVRNFLFWPNSVCNIMKSHKISGGKALYFYKLSAKNLTAAPWGGGVGWNNANS